MKRATAATVPTTLTSGEDKTFAVGAVSAGAEIACVHGNLRVVGHVPPNDRKSRYKHTTFTFTAGSEPGGASIDISREPDGSVIAHCR